MSCFCYFIEWLLMLSWFIHSHFHVPTKTPHRNRLPTKINKAKCHPTKMFLAQCLPAKMENNSSRKSTHRKNYQREVSPRKKFPRKVAQRLFTEINFPRKLPKRIVSPAQSVSPERLPKTPHGNQLTAKITKGKCIPAKIYQREVSPAKNICAKFLLSKTPKDSSRK